jgi:hypothetical protein
MNTHTMLFVALALCCGIGLAPSAPAGLPLTNQVVKYERCDSERRWREVTNLDGEMVLSCLRDIRTFRTWGSTVPRGWHATPIPAVLGFRIVSTSGQTNVVHFSSRGQLVRYRPIGLLLVVPDKEEESLAQLLAKWRDADHKRIASQPLPCQYRIGAANDGITLSGIARLFYGDASKWPEIYEANRTVIKNPDIIQGGEVIKIPKLKE